MTTLSPSIKPPSETRQRPPGLRDACRADFLHVSAVSSRWTDNDTYGHVNNVNYYSYFDTAVNRHLIDEGALNIHDDPVVGFVVETGCSYFHPVSFPDTLHIGMRVVKLGGSSVHYELALFRNDEERASAAGHFVHVYVDRQTGRAAKIPDATRELLRSIAIPAAR